jgi:hypothetical protein
MDLTETAEPAGAQIRFIPSQACVIAGVAPASLRSWEAQVGRSISQSGDGSLSLSELIGLCVIRELAARVGDRITDFRAGIAQLFDTLATRPDLESLDGHTAIVGRDLARLCELKSHHVTFADDGYLAVPLHPLLAELRDRVFS